MRQGQFLEVLDRDEAEARWREALDAGPLPSESVALEAALGRVLAEDVRAEVDVPGFDRSNMDGFAVRAEDTYGASEDRPVRLRLPREIRPQGLAQRGLLLRHGKPAMVAQGSRVASRSARSAPGARA